MGSPRTFRSIVGVATSVAFICASAPASAEQAAEIARLVQMQGTVLVDTGSGFVRVLDDVGLRPGDRVLVADDGGALLDYGDNCTVPLEAPSMTVVEEAACSTTTQAETTPAAEDGSSLAAGIAILGLGGLGVGGYFIYKSVTEDEDSMSP